MNRFFALLLAIAYAMTASGQTVPNLGVEKHQLPNGLEVLLLEDHRIPRVALAVWYHVGPRNESAGRTGFAHLFEHMMFQRSKHVPEDQFFKILEGAGASDMNGMTDNDRTNYFETMPSNQLELALWLESDRMGYLLDTVDAGSLENQKDVVRNERRQTLENRPFGIVEEALVQSVFPAGHPYHGNVIGSHADIQAAKLEDVQSFFKQFYGPNNASIAIVGDIDKAAALKLVEKYFGSLKRGPDLPSEQVVTPSITSEKRLVIKDRVEVPRLYMAWLAPGVFKPGEPDARLAAEILGGGKSSRLYKSLVYENKIAQDVYADLWRYGLGSIFVIEATPLAGHTLEELEKEIDAQLEMLRQIDASTVELDRAKASVESSILFSLERLGSYNGIADRISMYNQHVKDPNYVGEDIQRHQRVSAGAVRRFVTASLTSNSRVVIYGTPGTPELGPDISANKEIVDNNKSPEVVNADEPWRSTPPAPAARARVTLPTPESFKLPNGLTILLETRRGVPVVSLGVVIRGGTGSNPADRPGLASFTTDMLEQGTSSRTASKIADELALIGASFQTRTVADYSSLTLKVIKRNLTAGFDLLSDIVMNPTFPPAELDRERQSRLGDLLEARQSAAQVANRVLAQAFFGPGNPYGELELGTEASVRRISRADLQSYWAQRFVPGNAALVVSGDITRQDLQSLLDKTFAAWKGSPVKPLEKKAPAPTSAGLVIVDKPGGQTQLRVALPGASRTTTDYESMEVMNAILGGMFTSRINLNLREEHGYTYGASSRFTYLRDTGWFTAGGGVRTDVTAPATRELLREIGRMSETPVKGEELAMARESLVGALSGRFEVTDQTVNTLTDLYVYGLGMEYFNQYATKVGGVTVEQVQGIARKALAGRKPIVVAVGDRAKIEEGLRELGLGTVEIRDLDGVVIK